MVTYTTYITNEDADETKLVGVKSTSVSEDLQNALRKKEKGYSKPNQTSTPVTKITDKKKISWTLTVTGHLETDDDSNYPTAKNKRDALLGVSPLGKMFRPKPILLYHRGVEYFGAMEKLQIKEDSSRLDTAGGGTNKYAITFLLVIGNVK